MGDAWPGDINKQRHRSPLPRSKVVRSSGHAGEVGRGEAFDLWVKSQSGQSSHGAGLGRPAKGDGVARGGVPIRFDALSPDRMSIFPYLVRR